jgi:hypothetical protein
MNKQSVTVQRGEDEKLSVLGCEVRFLCDADKTKQSFSVLLELPWLTLDIAWA